LANYTGDGTDDNSNIHTLLHTHTTNARTTSHAPALQQEELAVFRKLLLLRLLLRLLHAL